MKEPIKKMFERLEGEFDIEMPPQGHQQRFLNKLNKKGHWKASRKYAYLKPLIAVAASVVIVISVIFGYQLKDQNKGLAGVSPEMAKTQYFYSSAIEKQLRKIKKQERPETQVLIRDAMVQMGKLKAEYINLQKDLRASGENNSVIFAMITNFQNRINLLKNLLEQIKRVEQLKQKSHEKPITI